MFRLLLLVVATYVLFTVQTSLARELSIAGIVPQIPCAVLVLLVTFCRGRTALICTAVWGLIADLLGDGRVGINSVCFTFGAAALDGALRHLPRGVPMVKEISGALIVLLCNVLCIVATSAMLGNLRTLQSHWPTILWQSVYTASIAFVLLTATKRWTGNDSESAPDSTETVSNRWNMLTE